MGQVGWEGEGEGLNISDTLGLGWEDGKDLNSLLSTQKQSSASLPGIISLHL